MTGELTLIHLRTQHLAQMQFLYFRLIYTQPPFH
jgi:hypothetical protein